MLTRYRSASRCWIQIDQRHKSHALICFAALVLAFVLFAGASIAHAQGPLATTAGSISGVVFDDRNANSVQDSGEPGIAGITIRLLLLGETSSVLIGEVNTDLEGRFQFGDLAAGRYRVVQVTQVFGSEPTTADEFEFDLAVDAQAVVNFGDVLDPDLPQTIATDLFLPLVRSFGFLPPPAAQANAQ